jgi:hypothetical protein
MFQIQNVHFTLKVLDYGNKIKGNSINICDFFILDNFCKGWRLRSVAQAPNNLSTSQLANIFSTFGFGENNE